MYLCALWVLGVGKLFLGSHILNETMPLLEKPVTQPLLSFTL